MHKQTYMITAYTYYVGIDFRLHLFIVNIAKTTACINMSVEKENIANNTIFTMDIRKS